MSTPTEEFEGPMRSGIDRRLLAVVGALVLLLLALLWFFVPRGSPEPDQTAAPAPPAAPTPASEPDPKGDETAPEPGGGGPVETFQVFAPRDPFEPLVSPDDSDSAVVDTGATVDTGGGVITNPDSAITGEGASGSGGSTVGSHTVSVVDVFAASGRRRAQVEVDGTVYKVSEGERFADSFQLLSASGECAGMLFGDDQFTLCEGEEILK
jgi:hypothetical protein